jgi:hypothetical protein
MHGILRVEFPAGNQRLHCQGVVTRTEAVRAVKPMRFVHLGQGQRYSKAAVLCAVGGRFIDQLSYN